ncbi:hypothetical protein ACHAXN_003360 [Cyclotella atomus]
MSRWFLAAAAVCITLIITSTCDAFANCKARAAAFNSNTSLHKRRPSLRLKPLQLSPQSFLATQSYNARNERQHAFQLHASSKDEPLDLPSLKRLLNEAIAIHDQNLSCTPPLSQIASRLSDLETESSSPDFWDSSNSIRNNVVTRDIAKYTRLKSQLNAWDKLRKDAQEAFDMLVDLYQEESSSDDVTYVEMMELTYQECKESASSLLTTCQKYELQTLLSGPYDASPCTILLTAGAGGTEACDWVDMLYRMYTRHASHMGYRVETVEATPGDVVGYKSVELRIECGNVDNGDGQSNHHPYGWFKGEKGAHRLVRLSPFNANNKRQTTFAGVDVVPILEEEEVKDVDIPEKELEITTMRSGGKGGQNVNKVETGVRIKHLPSGIAVKCTEERSQGMNKQRALARLKGQLLAIAQEQRLKDIQSIRGDVVEASWGAQIRNYVMQPYKLVKDGRSGWESSDVDGFLDGGQGLEDCIGSLLRWRRGVEEEEREEADLKGV